MQNTNNIGSTTNKTNVEKKYKEIQKFEDLSRENFEIFCKNTEDNYQRFINVFNRVAFTKFNSENPYKGDTINMIFMYHRDHHPGNRSTECVAHYLIHPNINMFDRGYTKGIAVDLWNFGLLSPYLSSKNRYIDECKYYPFNQYNFRKSKKREIIKVAIDKIAENYLSEKNKIAQKYYKMENEFIYEHFGCSLNFYSKEIDFNYMQFIKN